MTFADGAFRQSSIRKGAFLFVCEHRQNSSVETEESHRNTCSSGADDSPESESKWALTSKEAVLASLMEALSLNEKPVGLTLAPAKNKRAVHESMAARHAEGKTCCAVAESTHNGMVYIFRRDPVPLVSCVPRKEDASKSRPGRPQVPFSDDLDECSEEFFICGLSRQKAGISRRRAALKKFRKGKLRRGGRSSGKNRPKRHGPCHVDGRTRKEILEELAMETERTLFV